MKSYARFMWVGILCGIFCILGIWINVEKISLIKIIAVAGQLNVYFAPGAIADAMYWVMPLILFQILYGTCIYQHFCSASVYFFSRDFNRIIWYLKETAKLYLFILIYLCLFLISGTFFSSLWVEIIWDNEVMYILLYYLLIYSFYLFVSTLAINIISIATNSSVGFCVVMIFESTCMAAFFILGRIIEDPEIIITKYRWAIKYNPYARLVFGMHGAENKTIDSIINQSGVSLDLNASVFVFFVASVIVLLAGVIVVKKHEFIICDREHG